MSYHADETYDVYDERHVKAAKTHKCAACKELILKGQTYMKVGIVFDHSARSVKRCLRCQAMHEHLRTIGWKHEMWPQENLGCGIKYEEEWGKEPPPEIAALAFQSGADLQPKDN